MNDNVLKINEASIGILNDIGFEVDDIEILNILEEKGIKVVEKRVFFTKEQIQENLANAPSEFVIYARNSKYDMKINTSSINYAPPYGCPQIRMKDGNIRPATLEDNIKFSKMVHSSEFFNINGGILAHPNDVDGNISTDIMLYTSLIKSDKCIMGVTANKESLNRIYEILDIVFYGRENLREKVRMISLVNTLSPLSIAHDSLTTLKMSCENNQAVLITPGPMKGATSPITTEGTLAMSFAETLAVSTIAQIIKPGIPVVFGSCCHPLDVHTAGMAVGSPEYALANKYSSKLAKLYNIPCRMSAATSDANGPTIQCGYEAMFNLFIAHQEGANFLLHSAGVCDGFSCISYEKFISDLEILSMLNYYKKDINVDEKSLLINAVRDVVNSNSNFLSHKSTAKGCRKVPWKPTIAKRNKQTLEDTPNNLMQISIENQMNKLLNEYEGIEIDKEIKERLDEYMISIGVEKELLDFIKNY